MFGHCVTHDPLLEHCCVSELLCILMRRIGRLCFGYHCVLSPIGQRSSFTECSLTTFNLIALAIGFPAELC